MSNTRVAVTLVPADSGETCPASRSFTLSEANPSITLGRSSKRESQNRDPANDNGWFDSRVMSREHAELSICQDRKDIYICDSGSTHGTWLNNLKLITDEKTPLLDGDTLRFGVKVDRGAEEFPPLSVRCEINWTEIDSVEEIPDPTIDKIKPTVDSHSDNGPRPTSSSNTFCVPEDDSDIEEIPPVPVAFDEVDPATDDCFVRPIPKLHDIINLDDDQGSPTKPHHDTDQARNFSVWDSEPEDSSVEQESEREYVVSEYSDEESDLELSKTTSSSTSESGVTNQATFIEMHEKSINAISDDDIESSDSDEDECIDPSILTQKNISETPLSEKVDEGCAGWINPMKDYYRTRLPPPNTLPGMSYRPQFSAETENCPASAFPLSMSSWLEPTSAPYRDGPFSWTYQSPQYPLAQHSVPNWRSPAPQNSLLEPFKDNSKAVDEEETLLTPTSPPLKRKASKMESQDTPQDAQKTEPIPPVSQEPELNTISQSQVVGAITSALSEAEEKPEAEPPTKRVKTSPSPSKNLAGYTATAVISALLGGLGTIALLAALPAEYFQ